MAFPRPVDAGNFSAGGDLSGTDMSQTVIGLRGRPVSSDAPTSGQTWEWSGTAWVPTTPAAVTFPLTDDDGTTTFQIYEPGPDTWYVETEDNATAASGRVEEIATTNAAISQLTTDDGLGHNAAMGIVSAGPSQATIAADGFNYFFAAASAGTVKLADHGGGMTLQLGSGVLILSGTVLPTTDPHSVGQVFADGYVDGMTPGTLMVSAG